MTQIKLENLNVGNLNRSIEPVEGSIDLSAKGSEDVYGGLWYSPPPGPPVIVQEFVRRVSTLNLGGLLPF